MCPHRNIKALQYTSQRIAEVLLHKGAKIDSKEIHGKSPLHLAARAGQLSMVQFLVKAGAPREAEDNQGSRPLHLAAR